MLSATGREFGTIDSLVQNVFSYCMYTIESI